MPTDLPDIFQFTSVAALLAAYFDLRAEHTARTALAEWIGEELGCSGEHVFNFLAISRKVQVEQVPALARRMQLDEHGREYLRRLVVLLTLSQIGLSELPSRKRPAVEIAAAVLPMHATWSRKQVGSQSPPASTDGRPCIYDTLVFADFARAWIRWRKDNGMVATCAYLAKKMGVSKTLANGISTGAVKLRPEHVAGVIRAYRLSDDEGHYLEGMARYSIATDTEDKARERHALLCFAAAQGVRTPAGAAWRVASYWGASAIWALASLPFFRANAAWISLALRGRIPVPDVQDLLDAMVQTGVLVPQGSGPPRPGVSEVQVEPPEAELASYAFHASVLRLLQHELILPARDQLFRGCVIALPEVAEPLVRACLEELQAEMDGLVVAAEDRARSGCAMDRVLLSVLHFNPVSTRLSLSLEPEVRRR